MGSTVLNSYLCWSWSVSDINILVFCHNPFLCMLKGYSAISLHCYFVPNMRGYFASRKKFVSRLVLLSKQRSQRIDRKIVGQWCWKFCNPIDWCIDIWKVVLLTKRTLWSRSLQTLKSPFFSYSDPLFFFFFREEDITGGLTQSVWHCSRMRQATNITRYDLWTKRVKTNFKRILFFVHIN